MNLALRPGRSPQSDAIDRAALVPARQRTRGSIAASRRLRRAGRNAVVALISMGVLFSVAGFATASTEPAMALTERVAPAASPSTPPVCYGKVTAQPGNGIAGVYILINSLPGKGHSKVVMSVRTGHDGTYRLRLPIGQYRLTVYIVRNRRQYSRSMNVSVTAGRTYGVNATLVMKTNSFFFAPLTSY